MGAGVFLLDGNTLTNTGTITAASTNGVGVDISGDGNTVTNSGLIAATGAGGLGGAISGQNNTVVNNGTIRGGTNGYSLFSSNFLASGNSVTNNGTLDGRIELMGSGDSLINAGLITITDPGTALAVSNLAFAGTFTQTAQGTLALRVDNAGNRDGLSAVQANLNGTLRAVLQPGLYQSSTTYTGVVQTTAAITGQFATVTSSSAFFNAAATYNANSVDLILTRQGFGAVAGETQNQRAIGNALEAGYSTALTGSAATFYAQLLQAGSLRALDQLSGEGTSGTQNTAFNSGVLFGQTMFDPVAIGLGEFGKPGNYFARQIDRWTKQYRASETQHIPEFEKVAEWLPKTVPEQARVSIVHGDYRLDNMLIPATRA